MQLIGLLDCNNFFVSCERLFRPDLQGRPVVVLSGNDGCVVARSNEVKALGIPMGIPYFQVKQELAAAKVAIFSSNFTLYRDISARVMQTVRSATDTMEQYSVDEAFFTVDAADEAAAAQVGEMLKAQIEQTIGVPVSIGIARSKTIAKYASEMAKQDAKTGRGTGVAVLLDTAWQARTTEIPLEQVWGIGVRLSTRLREHALHTVADLLAADRNRVAQLFGVSGVRLYDELSQCTVWQLGSRAGVTQKSYMSTRSFAQTVSTEAGVMTALTKHVTQVAKDLRADEVACRYLQVMARPSRHGDWVLQKGTAEYWFDQPTNDTRVLLTHARTLLRTFFDPAVPYKKAGVVVGGVVPVTVQQATLFAETTNADDGVMALMDSLNERFGTDIVTVGSVSRHSATHSLRERLSPHYTTQWSDIPVVRT